MALKCFKNSPTQKDDMHILDSLFHIISNRIITYIKIKCKYDINGKRQKVSSFHFQATTHSIIFF